MQRLYQSLSQMFQNIMHIVIPNRNHIKRQSKFTYQKLNQDWQKVNHDLFHRRQMFN